MLCHLYHAEEVGKFPPHELGYFLFHGPLHNPRILFSTPSKLHIHLPHVCGDQVAFHMEQDQGGVSGCDVEDL